MPGKYEGWSPQAVIVKDRLAAVFDSMIDFFIPLTVDEPFILANPHLPFVHKILDMSLRHFTDVINEHPGTTSQRRSPR